MLIFLTEGVILKYLQNQDWLKEETFREGRDVRAQNYAEHCIIQVKSVFKLGQEAERCEGEVARTSFVFLMC